MENIKYIIAFYCFALPLHELGHFLGAKIVGFSSSKIAIGIGPRLFSIKVKELLISFSLIPFFGYTEIEELSYSNRPHDISIRAWNLKRIVCFFSGPLMSLLFTVLIFGIIGNVNGVTIVSNEDEQLINYNIENGYKLAKVNGKTLYKEKYINDLLVDNDTNILDFKNQSLETKTVRYVTNNSNLSKVTFKQSNIFSNAWDNTCQVYRAFITLLKIAFNNDNMPATNNENLNVTPSFNYKTNDYLKTIAVISSAGFFFNLLPIWGLDGFRILCCAVSLITNKQLNKISLIVLNGIGISGLILYLFFMFFNI